MLKKQNPRISIYIRSIKRTKKIHYKVSVYIYQTVHNEQFADDEQCVLFSN